MLKVEPKGTAERIRDLISRRGAIVEFTRSDEWIVASFADEESEPLHVQGGSVSEATERLYQSVIG